MFYILVCLTVFCVYSCLQYEPTNGADYFYSPVFGLLDDCVSPWDTENISLDMDCTAICCKVDRPLVDVYESVTTSVEPSLITDEAIATVTDDQPVASFDYSKRDVAYLRGVAKSLKIKGYGKMRKTELVDAITAFMS